MKGCCSSVSAGDRVVSIFLHLSGELRSATRRKRQAPRTDPCRTSKQQFSPSDLEWDRAWLPWLINQGGMGTTEPIPQNDALNLTTGGSQEAARSPGVENSSCVQVSCINSEQDSRTHSEQNEFCHVAVGSCSRIFPSEVHSGLQGCSWMVVWRHVRKILQPPTPHVHVAATKINSLPPSCKGLT